MDLMGRIQRVRGIICVCERATHFAFVAHYVSHQIFNETNQRANDAIIHYFCFSFFFFFDKKNVFPMSNNKYAFADESITTKFDSH